MGTVRKTELRVTNVLSITGEPLDTSPPEIDPQLISIAEDLLAKVKSGEIIGFAAVGASEDGGTWMFRAGHQDALLVGRLEHLKLRIIDSWDD